MKTLNPAPRFLIYAVFQAVRHPRSRIIYYYCGKCKIRFSASEAECPKCGDKLEGNTPERREESVIPWWGAVLVIIIGVVCWVVAGLYSIAGLDEAGRALVYIPLGSLFGMSLKRD